MWCTAGEEPREVWTQKERECAARVGSESGEQRECSRRLTIRFWRCSEQEVSSEREGAAVVAR